MSTWFCEPCGCGYDIEDWDPALHRPYYPCDDWGLADRAAADWVDLAASALELNR